MKKNRFKFKLKKKAFNYLVAVPLFSNSLSYVFITKTITDSGHFREWAPKSLTS